ncbi:MAG: DUF3320 domain-containing protein, partial [Clostridia bacterium]|nr:DUF3320 domain-containing protein [Clostridia bacterium]
LPVEIVRKSANKGYVIRLRDDEPQINLTLIEMLKQDFGITVSGLDPLPRDGDGIDIRRIFATVLHAVMDMPRWDIVETANLGIFSFTRFVMWNDIRTRSEDLQQNPIVRSLIEGKLTWEAAAMDPGLKIPENTVLIPLPADASQLYAIESAAEGQSFVLHGPPGTGKSQTITALIANALARGKSILFIAEKMAALEVVQKRLKEIGIDIFCLELHSNKSKKRDVLEQLRAATEVTRETAPEEFERKAQLLAEMRSELDGYVNAVHSVQPCGMTAYQLINEYEANSSCPDIALFTAQQLEGMTREKLAEYEILAERLVAAARAVGHPKDHPLSPIRRDKYEQKIRTQFEPALEGYRTSSSALKEAYSAFGQHFGAGLPATREDCLRTVDASRMLMLWKDLPESLSKADELEKAVSAIAAAGSAQVMASEQLNSILSSWKPEFLSLDSAALTAEWNEANGKWMLPRMMAMNALKRKLAPYATCDIDADTLPLHFQSLDKYRQLKAEADRMAASLPDGDSAFFQQEWKDITEKAKKAQESAQQMYELTGSDDMRLMCVGSPDAMKAAEELSQAWTDFTSHEAEMKALLDFDTGDISEDWLERQQDIIDGILDSRDSLKDWMVWNQVAAECTEKGLGPIVQAYLGGLEHEKVLGAFRRSVYCTLTEMAIDQSETLSSFSGALMSEKIAQFKRMDKELMDLTRQEIYCRLAARVPNFTEEASQTSEIGILRRAIKSGGRGISIRRLLDQIPGLLPRLCPCMLMSPISAAQYLDPKRPPFDMVVFDEASQVPTCRAVGALARGKTAVIVGDPKQMPPTSFFTSTSEEDLTAEDGDLESILDDCLAINMPETHLLWHYRSRHESLIAFSNNQFYDNRLLTFPSAGDRESKVTLQHVDGVFDRGRGRSNRAEAEAVIAEMKRRCHDPALAKYSVGVVTFNVNQQHLIEDLLNEACRTDNKLEEWAWRSEEPVFIKNLENVQGDERDVILFSVGFGPDKNGKFYMNFGPLNRDGGWRRLNVAVSRARYEMKVFSTIHPEDIDLSRSSAEGVAALRSFLDYASGRPLPSAGTASILRKDKGQSGIANSIAAALRERGFECDISVGHSGYRVDVGVIDPRKPETYILGILLDGNSYRDAKTTRDREVAQESILTGLGWNILRLWSLDWWDNSRRETDRIAAAIVNLLEQPLPEAASEEDITPEAPLSEEVPEPSLSYEPEETPSLPEALRDPQAVEEYFPAVLTPVKWSNDEFMKDENTAELCSRLAYIVNCEAPVLQSTLIRRLLQSCGVSRGGARIQARALSLVDSMGLSHTMQGDERLYWRAGQDPQQFTGFRVGGSDKREPRDIPVIEAANAVCRVMENQIGLPMDGLVRETARILGYARAGSNVLTVVGAAIR